MAEFLIDIACSVDGVGQQRGILHAAGGRLGGFGELKRPFVVLQLEEVLHRIERGLIGVDVQNLVVVGGQPRHGHGGAAEKFPVKVFRSNYAQEFKAAQPVRGVRRGKSVVYVYRVAE